MPYTQVSLSVFFEVFQLIAIGTSFKKSAKDWMANDEQKSLRNKNGKLEPDIELVCSLADQEAQSSPKLPIIWHSAVNLCNKALLVVYI